MINASVMLPGVLYQSSMPSRWSDFDDIKPDVVINLAGQDYQLPQYSERGSICYVLWPIEDGPLPDDTYRLWNLAMLCQDAVMKKQRVLVHCGAGINRASLLTGCILFLLGKIQGKALVDYIRAKRPGALTNESFANFIEGLPNSYFMRESYKQQEKE